ncbi:hypothetical protein ACFVX9_24385 [Kitasatospora sp. NPDC058243]|uniref:hypothetical protein n=1 Tax=Kitasatospora sp. NPDC058243 TaxID=3346397 RepID=UPI0036DA1E93
MTTSRRRYTAVPADAPHGASYPVWVIRDRSTSRLVKALPPAEEPLRFYSYALAQAWVRRNTRPTALVTAPEGAEFEIRLIDSTSPHFLLLECWGLWSRARHEFLRMPGSSDRVRRFYTRAAAEAFRRHLGAGQS